MALHVTVGRPRKTDIEGVRLATVTVGDDDYPTLSAVFTYLVGWSYTLVLGELTAPVAERARLSHRRDELRIALRSVSVEPRPDLPVNRTSVLTVTAVRDLPLSRWDAAARAHAVDHPTFASPPASTGAELDPRRRRSMEHLRQIAERYRAHQREGTPDPAAAIAREDGVNRSTARSWIYRARQAGLLKAVEWLGPAAQPRKEKDR